MTASADVTDLNTPSPRPVRLADGSRMIIRGLQRVSGAGLVLAAVGIWFAPGSSAESDVMLFKLVLSISAVLAGFGLLHGSTTPRAPEIEIDTIRRQVRVVRRHPRTGSDVLQSCGFADLGSAELDGPLVRLWDRAGVLLAEVCLSDRAALNSLVAGLRDEGKLA